MKKITLMLIGLLSFPVFAQWQLNNEGSTVSFTTIKKQQIAENHHFETVAASISEQGKVQVEIDLTSVNTNIGIRDERMKEHLFNTSTFPKATFSTQLAADQVSSLTVGNSEKLQVEGTIDLHGQSQKITAEVLVTKVNEQRLLVASLQPLLIKAQDFDLVAGINKLQELAGLPSITHTVSVNFVLNFTAK